MADDHLREKVLLPNLELISPKFYEQLLSCVATIVLRMRLLHAVAFSKYLSWFG
jgi:hypothetical protein